MLSTLKNYYGKLSDEQKTDFCDAIGVQRRYVEYNLLGNAPKHLRRAPSKSLVDKIYAATNGEVPVLGILADFYPMVEAEFQKELIKHLRNMVEGEAKRGVDRDQSATALPLSAADQDSTKGDRNNEVSGVSTDQSAYEV